MAKISACPACDSANIIRTTQRSGGGKYNETDWWCEDCGEHFDEPHWRESYSSNQAATHGLARVLEEIGRANANE